MFNDKIQQMKDKEIEQNDIKMKSIKLERLRLRPISDNYSVKSTRRV